MKPAGYIILKIRIEEEEKRWIAYCDELGISAFARNFNDANERLRELVTCHLNALEAAGIRERVFKENGIRFYESKPHIKTISVSSPINKNSFVQSYLQPISVSAHA
jgi:hypothetical protein